jgi:hypothetical protein
MKKTIPKEKISEFLCRPAESRITLVADIKDSKVIFACEGKDSSTICQGQFTFPHLAGLLSPTFAV